MYIHLKYLLFLFFKRWKNNFFKFIFDLLLINNRNTHKIEIKIKENNPIYYMNITRDGLLITCLGGIFANLYEINGKEYKIIQAIKPYSFLMNIIAKYNKIPFFYKKIKYY